MSLCALSLEAPYQIPAIMTNAGKHRRCESESLSKCVADSPESKIDCIFLLSSVNDL